jgi:hypothetical protein
MVPNGLCMTEAEFDAACLREIFEACAQNQSGWLLTLKDFRHPWRLLYMGVTDRQEGLAALQTIQWQQDEIGRLQQEVDLLRKTRDDRIPDYVRPELK